MKISKKRNKLKFFKRGVLAVAMATILAITPFAVTGCASDGADGINGKSAYELALENGYVGTLSEWLETLKGETGVNGRDGVDGVDGQDGATWLCGDRTPDANEGKNGDFYLNKKTFSVYEKVNGIWEYVTTFATTDNTALPKQGWEEDGELKLLSVGNSFSDDSLEYVYDIAQDFGVENVEIGKLYIAGCSLETHLSNAQNDANAYTYYTNTSGVWSEVANYDIETAVKSTNWDYIIFQQNSNNSGLAETYDDLPALIDIVSPMAPRANLVWNMTWAYPEGSSHSAFSNYDNDQITMYNSIVSAVNTKILTNNTIDLVIPVGTAVQNARSSYLTDSTIARDYCHLSHGMGTYLASLTVFQTLTGVSVSNVKFVPTGENSITSIEKIIAVESALNANEHPFVVTQSEYDEITDAYKLIDTKLRGYGYYNSTDPDPVHYQGSTPETSTGVWVEKYLLTDKFTREELPVGTIIEIASGYGYRPEGWIDGARNTSRPDEVTAYQVVVDEAWWGDFTERAFNIYASGKPTITDETYESVAGALKIYVPKY